MKIKKNKLVALLCLITLILPLIPLNLIKGNGNSSNNNEIQNLNRVIIVGNQPNSYIDDFALLASIPANIFISNGVEIQGPIIKSDLDYTSKLFLDDWKIYCDKFGGVSQAIIIGNITYEERAYFEQTLDQRIIPQIEYQDVFTLSNKLANFDWTNSDYAVLSVITDPQQFESQIILNRYTMSIINAKVNTSIYSNSINSGNTIEYNISTDDNVGWLATYIDWYKDNILTHQIIDPTGFIIDNTTIYTSKYTEAIGNKKLVSILPNIKSGLWNLIIKNNSVPGEMENFSLSFKKHPGISRNISVPSNSLWLNVSIEWGNPFIDLDLIIVNPSGRIIDWDILPNQIYSNRSVSIPFPEEGEWRFIVGWWGGSGSINFDTEYKIEKINSNLKDSILSSQNGAIIASLHNAPLIYTKADNLTQELIQTINNLNITRIFLVDINNKTSQILKSSLNSISNVEYHFTNFSQIYNYLFSINNKSEILLTYPLEDYCSISSTLAAAQNKPILILSNDNITSLAKSTWTNLKMKIGEVTQGINEHPVYFERSYFDESVPQYYSMVELSKEFDKLISSFGINQNLTITLIAPESIIPVSFDRSILGKHIIGRFANSKEILDGILMRNIFLNSIKKDNSEFDCLLSLYAYSHGSNFTDSGNKTHQIYNKDNITSILSNMGFRIYNHTAVNSIINTLQNDIDLWILSTHGLLDSSGLREKSKIILRDIDMPFYIEPGGTEENPDTNMDGLVDPLTWYSEQYRFINLDKNWINSNILKLDNTMIITTVCLIGPKFANVFLEKGALFLIGSYRTVSFQAGSWFNYLIVQNFLQNISIGEALVNTLINSSTIYSLEKRPNYGDSVGDFTLQFILYGDPTITLTSYNESAPECLSIDDFESKGHTPSKGTGLIAILGKNDFLSNTIDWININYNYSFSYNFINISETNYEELISRIGQYQTMFIESDSVSEVDVIFQDHTIEINNYINSGGSIIIFNLSKPILWTPIKIYNTTSESGVNINFASHPHPLKNYPFVLNDNYSYNSVFTNHTAHEFDIIANGQGGPVWLASNIGSGKISILSFEADFNNCTELIMNLLIWPRLKGLTALISSEPNSPIIYQGDQILIKVNVNDIFNWPVPNSSIIFILNGFEIEPLSFIDNQFIFNITENITLGTIKIEVLVWKNDAEAGYQTYFFEVRYRSWLLIGLGIFIIISISGYIAFQINNQIKKRRLNQNEN